VVSTLKGNNLGTLDLEDSSIYMNHHKVDVGIATEKCLKTSKPSENILLAFKDEMKLFLKAIVAKILEKAPITYPLTRLLCCLNPSIMATDSTKAVCKLKGLLTLLAKASRVSWRECDSLKMEFSDFVCGLEGNRKQQFAEFSPSTQRLDEFLCANMRPDCASAWKIVQTVMLLSHGQASVERGFSFNKEIVCDNLKEKSLIAQRTIVDYLNVVGGTDNIVITKSLLNAAAMGRQNYSHYLEQEKERKTETERKGKRKAVTDAIDDIKTKKIKLVQDEKDFKAAAGQYADKAEALENLAFLKKSNDLRYKADAATAQLVVVERDLQAKLQELAAL